MRNWVILRQNSTLQSAGLCWKHDKLTLSLYQIAKMMLQRCDRCFYHRYTHLYIVLDSFRFEITVELKKIFPPARRAILVREGEGVGNLMGYICHFYEDFLLTVINRSTIIKKPHFFKLNYKFLQKTIGGVIN